MYRNFIIEKTDFSRKSKSNVQNIYFLLLNLIFQETFSPISAQFKCWLWPSHLSYRCYSFITFACHLNESISN